VKRILSPQRLPYLIMIMTYHSHIIAIYTCLNVPFSVILSNAEKEEIR
jgi:hypothetical protein